MIIEETEFKGRPTLTLRFDEEDKYPFSFGVGKAKKILAAIDEIKAFVQKYDKPRQEEPKTDDIPAAEESED